MSITKSAWVQRGFQEFIVSMDYPGGPPLAELLPLFRRINAHKPLIITGPMSGSELDMLLQALIAPEGLSSNYPAQLLKQGAHGCLF